MEPAGAGPSSCCAGTCSQYVRRRYGRGFPGSRLGRRGRSPLRIPERPAWESMSAQPRLSWRLTAKDAAARGLRQTAYRILVSSSPEQLAKDEGDLWDSGDVASDHRFTSSTRASRWRRASIVSGRCGSATRPASSRPGASRRWSMGLLEPGDWQAKWIGTDAVFSDGRVGRPRTTRCPTPGSARRSCSGPRPPGRSSMWPQSATTSSM